MRTVHIRPAYILMPVILIISLIILKDSKYYDMSIRWVQKKILIHGIKCEGDQELTKNIVEIVLNQPSRYLPTSISVASQDSQGRLTTCVTGWNDEFLGERKTDNETKFMLASITKIFTADIILELVRNNQLDLEDNLVDLLPELKNLEFKDKRIELITVEQLLLHKAGFDRTSIGVGDKMYGDNPLCPYEVERLKDEILQFTPNDKTVYSNLGFCLLSRIAEEKYQLPYREIVRKNYHLGNYKGFDFVDDANSLPNNHMIILPEILNLDYQAMSSWAGLYGSPSQLIDITDKIDTDKSPSIFQSPNNLNCNIQSINGCPTYMGYRYSENPLLNVYWKDGSMPDSSSLIIIDDKGGAVAVVTNTRRLNDLKAQLVKQYYRYRLSEIVNEL